MRFAPRSRRLLHFLLAAIMTTGLSHGASMIAAAGHNAAHLSPHRHHAEHLAQAAPGSGPAAPVHNPEHEHGTPGTMPGCPLANVAAVAPVVLVDFAYESGVVISRHTLPPLISADPRLLDPPPRTSV